VSVSFVPTHPPPCRSFTLLGPLLFVSSLRGLTWSRPSGPRGELAFFSYILSKLGVLLSRKTVYYLILRDCSPKSVWMGMYGDCLQYIHTFLYIYLVITMGLLNQYNQARLLLLSLCCCSSSDRMLQENLSLRSSKIRQRWLTFRPRPLNICLWVQVIYIISQPCC